MSQANTSWNAPTASSSTIQRNRPLFRNDDATGSQVSKTRQRQSSLQAFIPKLDTTVEALRETSAHATPRIPGKSDGSVVATSATGFNQSKRTAPNTSILNDSRVLNASALRFQEADDFQRSAVSSIVNRIKNRPQSDTAGSSSYNHKLDPLKDGGNREHLQNIEQTQTQLRTLEDQLNALVDRSNQDTLREMTEKSRQKMKSFENKNEQIWDELNEKMKAERQRERLLLKVLDKENNEIEELENEIEELSKDLARTENIKGYLTERKRALWALKKAHESDRGTLVNQDSRIAKLHLENRALRRKELERLKRHEGSEEQHIQRDSSDITRKIKKMEEENSKLRHDLDKLTLKQGRK